MHYLGSKSEHAAQIIEVTTANRRPGQLYVEPFVGGGNVIVKVPAEQGPRMAADINKQMIALLDAIANKDWLPPLDFKESQWKKVKRDPVGCDLAQFGVAEEYRDAFVAFCATGPTFGSSWFSAWVNEERDRWQQARRTAAKDAKGLAGVVFKWSPFDQLELPAEPCIIYCDPPYSNTATYEGAKQTIKVGEDSNKNTWKAGKFWRWADKQAEAGHYVFVSEYTGPDASMYTDTVGKGSPTLTALKTEYRELQRKPPSQTTQDMFFELQGRITAEEAALAKPAAEAAARWQVVWEKRVYSYMTASAGKSLETGGAAMEKLFHRAP